MITGKNEVNSMGIITNVLVIALCGLLGSRFKRGVSKDSFRSLGICIVIVSLVGFFENVYHIQGGRLVSENLTLVLMAYIIGSALGEKLRLNQHLSNLGKSGNAARNAVIDAFLYFGIGGLQICGPIALATQGDNSQLFLKSVIDLPFAVIFGATYGPWVALAAIPVGLIQAGIALIAWRMGGFFTDQVVMDLCSVGYIILFFSGFNLFADSKNRINNINMLPSILIILLYYGVKALFI